MKYLCLLFVALVAPLLPASEVEVPARQRPPVYDRAADGEQQLADALARAKPGNKRVLAMFGANWCIWCHRLHGLLQSDPALGAALAKDYEIIFVDVDKLPDGTKHNAALNDRLANPIREGLPVLVIFDADGQPLVTQPTGALEAGQGHDPAKVRAFLEKWARPQ